MSVFSSLSCGRVVLPVLQSQPLSVFPFNLLLCLLYPSLCFFLALSPPLSLSLSVSIAPGLSPGPQQWVTSGGEVGGLPGIEAPSEALPVWRVDPLPCSHSPGPTLQ